MSEQRKAVIKNADMEEKMQQDAVDIASKALSEYNIEKVRASSLIAVITEKHRYGKLIFRFLLDSARMLPLISKKNSIENMGQHGM